MDTQDKIIILVTNNGLGSGDPDQIQDLIKKYLLEMLDGDYLPSTICFYTKGVKLTIEGSPVIDELRQLEAKGVKLLVCLTCLQYYNSVDKLLVGTIASMPDIIQAQWKAGKIISL